MIKNFIKGSSWVIIGNFFSKIFSFAAISLLTSLLSPSELGIYNLILSFIIYAETFCGVGLGISLQRACARKDNSLNRTGELISAGLILYYAIITILCLLLLTNSRLVLKLFDQKITEDQLDLATFIFFMQSLSNFSLNIIIGFKKFRLYSIRSLLFAIIILLCTGIAAYYWGLQGTIIGYLCGVLVNFIIGIRMLYFILLKEKIKISLNINSFINNIKELLKDGFLYYIGNTLSVSLLGLLMISFLTRYVELEKIGYLRVAQSMAALVGFIPNSLTPVTISYFSSIKTSKNSSNQFSNLKSLQFRSTFFFVFLVTATVIFFIKEIVILLFDDEFIKGINIYLLNFMYTFLFIIYSLFVSYMVADGKSSKMALIGIINAIISAFVTYLFIPSHGIYAYFGGLIVGQLIVLFWVIWIDKYSSYSVHKEMICLFSLFIPLVFFNLFVKIDDPIILKTFYYCIYMLLVLVLTWKVVLDDNEVEVILNACRRYYQKFSLFRN